MRSRLKLWPGFPFRRITSAWGIALDERGVTLVCLGRSGGDVRVLQALHLLAPAWAQTPDSQHDWLVETLREASEQEVPRHRRLVLALPMDRCQTGVFHAPEGLTPEALQAEVQLEAAHSLNVSAQEVSFDFEVQTAEAAETHCVQWLACLRSEVRAWQRHTRAAGWRLPAIEHQPQSVRRALQCMRGDVHKLLAQAHQDWSFSNLDTGPGVQHTVTEDVLIDLQGRPAWAWLSACGAGLRSLS